MGKALLDAAKDWARERGATHLELDSGEARTDAHRFYEREGPSWRSVLLRLGALAPTSRIPPVSEHSGTFGAGEGTITTCYDISR